ncbi:MAG: efflux RND transporter periplasmic adaptor subunit [Thainema sp.]
MNGADALEPKQSNQQSGKQTNEPSQAQRFDDAVPSRASKRGGGLLSGSRGVLLGVGVGAVLTFVGLQFTKPAANESASAPAETEQVASQTVTASRVQEVPINQTLSATGTVEAIDLLPIAPRASGLQVQQVLVEEGNAVQAGQTLAVLDDTVLQSQIRQAEAQIESAQAGVRQRQAALGQAQASQAEAQRNFERYQTLANEGAISRETLDSKVTAAATAQESVSLAQADIANAEASVRSAEANLSQLRSQLDQTLVVAPADGIIAEKIARVGNVSSASDPLFTLIRDDLLELQVKVPQTNLAQVRLGAPVKITSSSDRRLQLEGRVREIAPLVDANTREATVKISLPSSPLLRPGMFLSAEIVTEQGRGFAIPSEAVMSDNSGASFIYALDVNNVVERRPIEVGARLPQGDGDAQVEVLSGLGSGDRIVVKGAGYVQEGDRVRVAE